MKSLERVQKISRVAMILSKIAFIVSLVGLIISIIVILSMVLIPNDLQIGGTTIKGIIEVEEGKTLGVVYTELMIGCVYLICEMIIAEKAEKYFKKELEDGTPFTEEGAKEIKDLGIAAIVIPIIGIITASIIYGILNFVYTIPENMIEFPGFSISTGIFFVILSVIFKYGADVLKNNEK